MSTVESLEDRVLKFLMLELDGQPPFMHMGTSYLVQDLMAEVRRLSAQPAAPQSLLRKPVRNIAEISAAIPGGCYCPPGECGAPIIMGRQTPCLRRKEEQKP